MTTPKQNSGTKSTIVLEDDLRTALDQFVQGDEDRPRTTLQDGMVFLIKKGLQAVGAWPRTTEDPEPNDRRAA